MSADRTIRIMHLIPGLEVGGAERSLVRLVEALPRPAFDCTVVSMTDAGVLGAQLEVPLTTLGMRRGRPSLAAWQALRALIRIQRPMILQTWLYHADLLGLAATVWNRDIALCWNLRCADMDLSRYRPLTRWVRSILALGSARPQAIVANSEAGREFHTALGYRPRRWAVIPNGFDTRVFSPDSKAREEIRRELGIPSEALLIGLVARTDPAKDHEGFIAAAARVLATRPDVRFLLVGSGVSQLCELVAAHGIANAVRLVESRADVARVMAALDIGCLSSAWGEGFPNVLGEMMACGVPCVTTDVGDARLLLGDTGRVVRRRSPDAFAAALLELAAMDSAARMRLGAQARSQVERHFGLASMTSRYAALYREISAACHGRPRRHAMKGEP